MGMTPQLGAIDNEYAMLLPLEPDGSDVTFVLNVPSHDRDLATKRAIAVLNGRNPGRVLDNAKTFSQVRSEYF